MEAILDQAASQSKESTDRSKSDAEDNEVNCYTSQTVCLLSGGLLDLYKPHLVKVKQQLKELTDKQAVLIEQLHNENLKLSWSQSSTELQEMFSTIKLYHTKLLNIKKDMRSLHERSNKLKKRAVKLQQHREKEIYLRSQQVKQEQDLVGKPNSSGK